jgi:two-component system, NarL family, nitrate/nitrite response regulator NarL
MGNDPSLIRILLADDHPIVRDGVRRLLETEPDFRVVGQAADGREAVRLVSRCAPDILLLDLAMPRLPGLEVLRELSASDSPVRTILLTAAIEKEQIIEALQIGARGVVLKEAATELLFKSIRTVMAGQYWVGRAEVADLVQILRALLASSGKLQERSFGLTRRELEILSTVVAGYSNKEIARQLSLSEDTVKHHLSHIFDKLGVSNRLELAMFAVNHRLVAP